MIIKVIFKIIIKINVSILTFEKSCYLQTDCQTTVVLCWWPPVEKNLQRLRRMGEGERGGL